MPPLTFPLSTVLVFTPFTTIPLWPPKPKPPKGLNRTVTRRLNVRSLEPNAGRPHTVVICLDR